MTAIRKVDNSIKKLGKINKKYKKFDFKVKGPNKLDKIKKLIRTNKALSDAAHAIFRHKKFLTKVTGAAVIVGVGAHLIHNFIQSNSGCFKQKGELICKIEVLSCCQKERVKNLPSCGNISKNLENVCEHYDDEKKEECCELCDCVSVGCAPGEEVFCQRPGIADALTHFYEETKNAVWSTLSNILPSYVWEILMGLLVVCLVGFVYQRFR